VSYTGRIQDALHDILEEEIPDGTIVDWKVRSRIKEIVNLRALPIFETEVKQQGARMAMDNLTKLVLERTTFHPKVENEKVENEIAIVYCVHSKDFGGTEHEYDVVQNVKK